MAKDYRFERYEKHVGTGSVTPGHARVLAHRMIRGQSVPLFRSRAANVAVEAHIDRITKRRTYRRRNV